MDSHRRPQLIGQSSGQSTLPSHLPATTVIVIRFANDVGDCAFHSSCLSHAVWTTFWLEKRWQLELEPYLNTLNVNQEHLNKRPTDILDAF